MSRGGVRELWENQLCVLAPACTRALRTAVDRLDCLLDGGMPNAAPGGGGHAGPGAGHQDELGQYAEGLGRGECRSPSPL